MATELITDDQIFTEIVADHEIPCDYAPSQSEGYFSVCEDEPAEWMLRLKRCPCGRGGVRLACTRCKEARLEDSAGSVECDCGAMTAPAREAYAYVERLDKGHLR